MEIKKPRIECNDEPLDLSIKKLLADDKNSKKLSDKDIFAVPKVPPQIVSIFDRLLAVECALSQRLRYITFSFPVEYVYNPIEYAFQVHAMYVTKYCRSTKKILFLGMNPGPWGMSQTGVPFGEVNIVRDWFKIHGRIDKPLREQADRLVTGFNCTRSEISGKRFWNLFKGLCNDDPDKFFRYSFLYNYCPIALMDAGGRNITPAEIKA